MQFCFLAKSKQNLFCSSEQNQAESESAVLSKQNLDQQLAVISVKNKPAKRPRVLRQIPDNALDDPIMTPRTYTVTIFVNDAFDIA